MNFIITNVENRIEHAHQSYMDISMDPYGPSRMTQQHMSFELTLRPEHADEQTYRKLGNIAQAGRTVTLNDTEYVDFLEPFRNEFIDFMMDKHPEKIISDPKSWDRLLGRS